MIVKIKRLFHGYATVRDTQAKEAFQKGEDLILECQGKIMRVPHKEILGGTINPTKYTSIHNPDETYYLIDYPFEAQMEQQHLL